MALNLPITALVPGTSGLASRASRSRLTLVAAGLTESDCRPEGNATRFVVADLHVAWKENVKCSIRKVKQK